MKFDLAGGIFLALAMTPLPARAHGIYTDLQNSKGQVCCNNYDCAPVEQKDFSRRVDANGDVVMSVQRGGKWYDVDPENILDSPDNHMHACVYFGEIRCFLKPAGD